MDAFIDKLKRVRCRFRQVPCANGCPALVPFHPHGQARGQGLPGTLFAVPLGVRRRHAARAAARPRRGRLPTPGHGGGEEVVEEENVH